jgi:pyroglutamyl-peptidase
MSAARTVLLTGFGPFPGIPVNASGLYVPAIARAARTRFPDVAFKSAVLPTEWMRGPARVQAALKRARPDLAIHFGVSSLAHGFVIERRGMNTCVAAVDGAGHMPPLALLDADGPNQLPVTLPVAAMIARLHAGSYPARASDDAGGYLCNAVLFRSLALAAAGNAPKWIAGFVHIPASLAGGGADHRSPQPHCPLTPAQLIAGSLDLIAVCLGR